MTAGNGFAQESPYPYDLFKMTRPLDCENNPHILVTATTKDKEKVLSVALPKGDVDKIFGEHETVFRFAHMTPMGLAVYTNVVPAEEECW